MPDTFDFVCPSLRRDSLVVAFHGLERLSEPFRFDVFLSCRDDVDIASLLGARGSLEVHRSEGTLRTHGALVEAESVDRIGERFLVRVALAPRLNTLSLGRHSRVFTKMSIPGVIESVLRNAGFTDADFRLSLGADYPVEEHVCQYDESDLAFVTRWLEREGMYYFFEHGDDAETLVIVDDKSVHEALRTRPVRYRPAFGRDTSADECFDSFSCKKRVVPGKIRFQDHDYGRPALDVSGSAPVGAGGQATEVVVHGDRFFDGDEGGRLARVHAEARAARQTMFEGHGTVSFLRSGYLFELDEHPRAEFNTKYLCMELEHWGNQRATTDELRRLVGASSDRVYSARAGGIRAGVQHRSARSTPWPRVRGMTHALIDGPAESRYAQIDDDGRYNVKFSFDESALDKGNASTRIRMMQPHAGNPEGFHMPARKGTEVMVAFLGGDPDRPVIAGTVPNAARPSPVTSANATRNIFHSGSDNHVEVEDRDGAQWIDFRTPPKNTFLHLGTPHDADSHYIVANTQGDCLFEIGSNQDIFVGGNLTEKVQGAVIEKYSTSQTSDVTGTQTTRVSGPVEEWYSGGHSTTTTGLVLELYAEGQKTTVSGGLRDETYNASQATVVDGGVKQTFASGNDIQLTGNTVMLHDGQYAASATGLATFQFDSSVTRAYGPTTRVSGATTWNVPGGIDIFTDHWSLTQEDKLRIMQSLTDFILTRASGTGVSISLGFISVTITQLSIGLNLYKNSTSWGMAASLTGVSLSYASVHIHIDGVKMIAAVILLA